ncbi:hypothetical protein ACJA23_02500 [Mycoplasma corogypsi]|uniref:hypothetical protein n=1 Tax=Mycoplasma corogypsi TaxID=2106 RepID=UPI003873A30E
MHKEINNFDKMTLKHLVEISPNISDMFLKIYDNFWIIKDKCSHSLVRKEIIRIVKSIPNSKYSYKLLKLKVETRNVKIAYILASTNGYKHIFTIKICTNNVLKLSVNSLFDNDKTKLYTIKRLINLKSTTNEVLLSLYYDILVLDLLGESIEKSLIVKLLNSKISTIEEFNYNRLHQFYKTFKYNPNQAQFW